MKRVKPLVVPSPAGIVPPGPVPVIGMLALNGLPQPYHPVFNVPRFALASQDKFFLAIEASDPKFDAEKTRKLLEGTHAAKVEEVED
mgnify:CR=1 FL=1